MMVYNSLEPAIGAVAPTTKRNLYLGDRRYALVLRRQRDRIEGGLAFDKYNCDETGFKDSWATWGLCSRAPELWPDADDRLFERSPTDISPKYRNAPHKCPMDGRKGEQGGMGCFYACKIFKRNVKAKDRETAVALYDAEIANFERLLAQRRASQAAKTDGPATAPLPD
jgi:hypothetical protein